MKSPHTENHENKTSSTASKTHKVCKLCSWNLLASSSKLLPSRNGTEQKEKKPDVIILLPHLRWTKKWSYLQYRVLHRQKWKGKGKKKKKKLEILHPNNFLSDVSNSQLDMFCLCLDLPPTPLAGEGDCWEKLSLSFFSIPMCFTPVLGDEDE